METREKISKQLDVLFVNAPRSKAAWELQEELLVNCIERYDDLVAGGMTPEQAETTVIDGIGNVDELIAALPQDGRRTEEAYEGERRQRSALIMAISIGLYIFAGAILIISAFLSDFYGDNLVMIGFSVALFICIVPTTLLVYNAYRWPSYKKKEDNVVESFKEWNNDSQKTKSVRKAISSLIWTITLVAYFVISFLTFAWHLTWILFLVGACVEAAVSLIFNLRELR